MSTLELYILQFNLLFPKCDICHRRTWFGHQTYDLIGGHVLFFHKKCATVFAGIVLQRLEVLLDVLDERISTGENDQPLSEKDIREIKEAMEIMIENKEAKGN